MKIINANFHIEDTINGWEMLKRIELAGRTCYKSEDKITQESCTAFVRKIITSGHHSILEHEKITVRIICDRGITHEIVRHRIASYSQESTRYCNYSKEGFGKELTFIDPCFWSNLTSQDNWSKYNIWLNTMKVIEDAYLDLIELGASPQEARSVLPNSLKTEIVVTMNLREWRHFFNLRAVGKTGKPHSQMLEISTPMLREFQRLVPVVFDDITI